MSKIATVPAQAGEQKPVKPTIEAGGPLAALTPRNIEETFRLATALAKAGDMVPKHFQGRPEATMAAIVKGMEIGRAPMQALSAIAVINGRAVIWGDALPALMQRAGHHVDVEIEGEGKNMVAIATLTRGDTGKQIVRRFSMADAERAGLLGKPGPWQQYPQRMLMMRARAWAIRDGAADALMGLSIADEVQDHVGPEKAKDITPTPRPGRAVYAPPEPEDEPEIDEITDAEAILPEEATDRAEHEVALPMPADAEAAAPKARLADIIIGAIEAAPSLEALRSVWAAHKDELAKLQAFEPGAFDRLVAAKNKRKAELDEGVA